MEFSLSAEKIFEINGFSVTNSLIMTIIIVVGLCVFAILFSRNISLVKPGRFQLFLEYVIDSLRNVAMFSVGKEPCKKIFPLVFTFFVVIILSNWAGLLPITGPLGIIEEKHEVESKEVKKEDSHEEDSFAKAVEKKVKETKEDHPVSIFDCFSNKCVINFNDGKLEILGKDKHLVPVFRPMTADLNGTVAFALFSVVLTNVWGFKVNGFSYIKKYINIPSKFSTDGVIYFFVGILETMLELSKILSYSFRLFGNIFAGEILLLAMYTLTKGIVSVPFLLLEIFVGFIQAYVFYMLTISFTGLSVEKSHH